MKKLSVYMTLALAGLFMTACGPEDNEFAGLKTAQADAPVTLPEYTVSVPSTVDLNDMEISDEQNVTVFTLSEAALPDGVSISKGEIKFTDGTIISTTPDGKVSGKELSAYVASIYGLRPEARSVSGTLYLYLVQDGAAVKAKAGDINLKVVPKAPVIAATYYLTGTMNGWDNTNTDYELGNGGQDPYANPTFTCKLDMEALGHPESIEFKATPVDGLGGDWSGCLGAGENGKFEYNNGGGNFKIEGISASTKFINLTFQMLDQTWSYKEVSFGEYFYEIGNESGWGTSHALFGGAGDGKYLGYYYLNGEFKFKPNADNWNDDLEYVSGDAVSGSLTDGGGPNCPDPGAGFYQINLDAAAMTYNLVKVNTISIIGTVNGNWDTDTDLTYNTETGAWETTATLSAGAMKFRMNHDWTISWGGANGDPTAFDNLTQNNGKDLDLTEAGTYKVQLFITHEGNNKVVVTKQ